MIWVLLFGLVVGFITGTLYGMRLEAKTIEELDDLRNKLKVVETTLKLDAQMELERFNAAVIRLGQKL